MRFDGVVTSALFSSALLVSGVRAQDAESSTSSAPIVRPSFTPANIKAPFIEQFTDDWAERWVVSKAKKEDPKSDEDWAYVGEWAVEEPEVFKGIDGDKGLVIKTTAAHHAISAKFAKPIDNKGKTLVVQYETKLQKGLECGGAYLKLLKDNKALHAEEFSNASPYVVMFGPDKCGSTNKVHFIVKHKNPKTGEYEEKHLKNPPMMKVEKVTNLYTLIVNPDQTYKIQINGETMKEGSMFDDFEPPFNPPKEIDDEKDSKPADWVDEARIPDPEAKKPEDWDEEAPFEIEDVAAEKPEDWLENEPEMVADPDSAPPEDWDVEEDGDWVAPMVPNPKCADVSGCGPWTRPMMKNPAFKGKWTPEYIDNPAYKGVWAPRKIANPNYFEDKTPANLEPMGAIGYELWSMSSDMLFDNIYIGHSVEDALKLKAETYDIKKPIEEALEKEAAPKPADTPASPLDLNFMDDPKKYIMDKFEVFMAIAQQSPVDAIKAVPEIAGAFAVGIITVLAILLSALGVGASSPQVQKAGKDAKKTVVDAKDKVVDAATSAVESAKESAIKRQTRSAASE